MITELPSSDIDKIYSGIGDRLSVFFQWTTTFVAGIVIGFIYEWRLTLVLLGATPFMIGSAAWYVHVSHLYSVQYKTVLYYTH